METEIDKYAVNKCYVCCKTFSDRKRIEKSAFKNQKSRTPYLITREDHRKTNKVIKVLSVKCALVAGKSQRNYNDS